MKNYHHLLGSLLLLAAPAWAGEGYTEFNSAHGLKYRGYGNSPAEIYSSPPVVLNLNTRCYDHETKTWSEQYGYPQQGAILLRALAAASISMGLWENAPNCRLECEWGTLVSQNSYDHADGTNVLTLTRGASSYGQSGACFPNLEMGADAIPYIDDFDVICGREHFTTNTYTYVVTDMAGNPHMLTGTNTINRAAALTAHELGHGLGLNHSYLKPGGNLPVVPSLMAEGRIFDDQELPVLSVDDRATLCRLYPDHAGRLSGSTGTVLGRLLDASGAKDLYGGCILLRNGAGQLQYCGISGYAFSAPSADDKNGLFKITGVAPGTYDLLALPNDHPWLSLSTKIGSLGLEPNGSTKIIPNVVPDYFALGFKYAVVSNIVVESQEAVDVGLVAAGESRSFLAPGWNEILVQAAGTATYSHYWFDFWSHAPSQLAHRSGPIGQTYCCAKLKTGLYSVQVYGWNGQEWVVVQPWKSLDCRARETSVAWPKSMVLPPGQPMLMRPAGTPVEARSYFLSIFNDAESTQLCKFLTLDALQYRGMCVPGSYRYSVAAAFANGEPTKKLVDKAPFLVP